jgi:uncharacterized SAM-binding protein YcdF (DUF218 family)
MRAVQIIIGLGAVTAIAWLGGGIWFASTMPSAVTDPTTRTDAIVVWTGGSGRIDEGLDLLAAGLSSKLFISGAAEQVRVADLMQGRQSADAALAGSITLGRMATDTPGNAVETAAWARQQNVASLRLVTAAYHMRRSLLELHSAMPNALIVAHPVFPTTVKADWWRWPGTAALIASEYTKYLVTWTRIRLGLATDLNGERDRP